MDDNPPSPWTLFNGFVTPIIYSETDLSTLHNLNDQNNESNMFVDNPCPDVSDRTKGANQSLLSDIDQSKRIDYLAALPKSHSTKDDDQKTEENSNEPCNENNTMKYTDGTQFIQNNTSHINRHVQDISDGIDGFDEALEELFDGISINPTDDSLLVLSQNNNNDDNVNPSINNSKNSFIVKSCDGNNTVNFIDSSVMIETRGSFILTVSPSLKQHVRYETELEQILRYINVPNQESITIKMSDVRNQFRPEISYWLRITRTTIPYGNNKIMFLHPYPIWLNNKYAKVYNGSLLIPVTELTIRIENLVMVRLQQGLLKEIQKFAIYDSQKFDFNVQDIYLPNTKKAKFLIDEYKLRYSIFHFQIFVVDEYNQAYPTDLKCQTDSIYEYDPKEIETLSPMIGNIKKKTVKRKSIGQRKKSKVASKTDMTDNDGRA
ncbi:unnamed protein product [Adineta steineri]|uniref:Uncharacterized protein n=1 Tax=Adineta steineri TaxID=433720 RepID=A0A814EYU4_9BILA|nr:unnamed protein product [Adineta steineri]CAF1569815.1 unnamed protein product [Adineta steineri]